MSRSAAFVRFGIFFAASLTSIDAKAAFDPDTVQRAEGRKTNLYLREGIFAGGDRRVEGVQVTGLRRGNNGQVERVVIDLAGSKAGESAKLAKPPYFQAGITSSPRRVTMTIWGSPRLEFDSRLVWGQFRKSSVIRRLDLLPNLDGDSWTFAMDLKDESSVEVFHLTGPTRIIVDIRSKK